MNALDRLVLATLALALSACAAIVPSGEAGDSLDERCERAFAALDAAVRQAGVGDAMAHRVPGFPYLRSSRLLASFADEPLESARFDEWIDRMIALDRAARRVEIANLPPAPTRAVLESLQRDGFPGLPPSALLEGCGRTLRERDLARPETVERLRVAVRVPDDYETWKRIVGLYALTAIPFSAGVTEWRAATRAAFDTPLEALPVRGTLIRYGLAHEELFGKEEVRTRLESAARGSALGLYDERELRALLPGFAPIFEIDTVDENDRIGRPGHRADGLPYVDVTRPAIFARATQTRYRGRVLPQLVYSIWFPSRPLASPTDLLGGRMDGLIWRVTLAPDGETVLFDTIHPCGCYHLFFPTPRATWKPPPGTIEERALVPRRLPRLAAGERLVVRVESHTHYVMRVTPSAEAQSDLPGLRPADDDALRTLPLPAGGTRSLFGPDGIVAGTERGERYVFWPMGIREPGAMRQWGRHPVAFVGRRHFDQPDLIEQDFELDADGTR